MTHHIPASVAVRPLLSAALIALLAAVAPRPARAGVITVPDGTFSNTPANGTALGTLVFGSTTRAIGDGTWSATLNGLNLGFGVTLAAPTLSIGNGVASITGVASLLGQQNGGYFSQVLGATYAALTTYTLTATVTTGSALGTNLFANTGVGIGLTDAGGNLLASSVTPSATSVALLGGTTYQVSLTYTTGSSPSGAIGIRLFDTPNGLAGVNVLGGVTFDNVALSSSTGGTVTPAALVAEPASAALVGLGLLAPVAARRRRHRAA